MENLIFIFFLFALILFLLFLSSSLSFFLNKNKQEKEETKAKGKENDNNNKWNCPPSAKSIRTGNKIRDIIGPIVNKIQSGKQRSDGKDHISLSVSF